MPATLVLQLPSFFQPGRSILDEGGHVIGGSGTLKIVEGPRGRRKQLCCDVLGLIVNYSDVAVKGRRSTILSVLIQPRLLMISRNQSVHVRGFTQEGKTAVGAQRQ